MCRRSLRYWDEGASNGSAICLQNDKRDRIAVIDLGD